MKIGILGSGPSSLYVASLIKLKEPFYEIEIFEKENKLAKKLRATGNGHANILPAKEKSSAYNNPSFMEDLIKRFPLEKQLEALLSMGIAYRYYPKTGYYPLSYNANVFASYLVDSLINKGVKFHLNQRVNDYYLNNNKIIVSTQKGDFTFDKLILAPGGASGKNLGSDGSFLSVLKKHGYKTFPFKSGLAPLFTDKKLIEGLFGLRQEVKLSLYLDNQLAYKEEGEIIFKEDAISGIASMNASSILGRSNYQKAYLSLDLFPELSISELSSLLEKIKRGNLSNYLDAFLCPPLSKKIIDFAKNNYKDTSISSLVKIMKNLIFPILGVYPFSSSQVSIGGVSLEEIDNNFASKKEKGVYFAGEILNIDGICGGYNLLFDLLNALAISEEI